jgi:S-adenosylmethionine:tRNA ribosyltransferase-isomerase
VVTCERTDETHGVTNTRLNVHIPEELIAQHPPARREDARLLACDIQSGEMKDDSFLNFPAYVDGNDCIVVNDTRVLNARLFGTRQTGGRVEALLERRLSGREWIALLKPARRMKPGLTVEISSGVALRVEERIDNARFRITLSGPVSDEELKSIGHIPLPAYIRRNSGPEDENRYQTVFARAYGGVASPTAGLHFTGDVLERIRGKGGMIVPVTLHVGWGTFEPIREEDYRTHRMHEERYEITPESADAINRAVAEGKRIVCVGTTSVRVVESAAFPGGVRAGVRAGPGVTRLFIYPGYSFKVAGALLTNFHMADSSLLLLVAAFAGAPYIERAYAHAVEERYRFFSYGDAMFLYNPRGRHENELHP